jgi:hypothetical protein
MSERLCIVFAEIHIPKIQKTFVIGDKNKSTNESFSLNSSKSTIFGFILSVIRMENIYIKPPITIRNNKINKKEEK